MSFFDKSRNFMISGGQFTNITTKTETRKKGTDLLYEHAAPGAFHNSAERYDPPKCHPDTRVAVIQAIIDWVEDDQKTTFIKWMYGAAGAGKSAIAQEIAERYHELGRLAASFFWSRSAAGRNNETHLIPSLAYQLLIAIPQIRNHVEEAVETDPSIFTRSIETQMESLIIGPLEKVFGHGQEVPINPNIPKLIILDGLDECGTPQVQQYILKVIAHSARNFPIPLCFLIASRPEQAIRASFRVDPLLDITAKLALDEKYCPDDDIRLFLVESFKSVKSTHELRSLLPHVWPTEIDIYRLIHKSSGQFIYPATVVKFVSTSRRMPDKQLDIILGIAATEKDTPFAELDALYHHIFSSVEDSPRALEILACLFLIKDLNADDAGGFIEAILSYHPGQLQLILTDLHSVIKVPDVGEKYSDVKNEHSGLHVLHASLQDFLMDPTRSRNFFIDQGKAHAHLAHCHVQYINSHVSNASDHDFDITYMVYENLQYHCSKSSPTKELLQIFFDFDFLKWASFMMLRLMMLRLEKITFAMEEYTNRYFQITNLYGWLQAQEANVQGYFGHEYSLSSHHSHSWEVARNLLCKSFCDGLGTMTDPDKYIVDKYIVTSVIMHPQIKYHSGKHDRCHEMPGPFNRILGCQFLDDFLRHIPHPVELQKYLCDPERAGTHLVHGGTYATLSAKIVEFIFDSETPEQFEEWRAENNIGMYEGDDSGATANYYHLDYLSFAIQILPFYLSNANYEPELARHASKVSTLKFQIGNQKGALTDLKELHQAIDLYLKKRPPTPEAESRLQKKHHMHRNSEESPEVIYLPTMTEPASPLVPPPFKHRKTTYLIDPDTGLGSDIRLYL